MLHLGVGARGPPFAGPARSRSFRPLGSPVSVDNDVVRWVVGQLFSRGPASCVKTCNAWHAGLPHFESRERSRRFLLALLHGTQLIFWGFEEGAGPPLHFAPASPPSGVDALLTACLSKRLVTH